MDYMFLIYADPQRSARLPPEERAAAMQLHWSITDDATARGVFRAAAPLEPVSKRVTVRSDGKQSTLSDGPFVETKEFLGGYYIISCTSIDEASYWAGRISHAVGGAPVEIRGIAPVPARTANA